VENFHVKLKDCREKLKDRNKKWTQQYVADLIGVARVTYTAYENGTKEPSLDTVKQLAEIFVVTTDSLLGKSSQPELTESEEIEGNEEVQQYVETLERIPENQRQILKERILAYARGLADASREK